MRHRRPRKPLVSPAKLLGTALSASLVAGVALGTGAAADESHHAHAAQRTADTPAGSATTDAAATSAGSPTTAATTPAGSATTAAAGISPNTAEAPSGPGDDDAGTSPGAPAGSGGSTGIAAGPGDDVAGELTPGKAPTVQVVVVGVPSAEAQRRKPRPLPPVAAKSAPAWVDPNPTAVVTSCFGERWGRLHAGVDLAAPDGTPIVAAGAGVVVRAGVEEGYGNAVLIDHGNGFLTHYGHLSKITVTVGQRVATGQQIGNEGSTGHSTGPHLHFEVHQGFYQNPIEPTEWMHQHGVDIPGCVPLS